MILEKRRAASNEKSLTAGFFMFLLDDDPPAVHRGLDGIDTYGTLAHRQRNALQVSDVAGMIRKHSEVQVISSVIDGKVRLVSSRLLMHAMADEIEHEAKKGAR